jgi:hypothetical protein
MSIKNHRQLTPFLAAPEGSQNVFISAVATKRQFDPGEDNLLVTSRGIEVAE